MATYMDPRDEDMALKALRGEVYKVEIPGSGGSTVYVLAGQSRYELNDGSGRVLRISWLESFPPKPGKIELVQSAPYAGPAEEALASGISREAVAVGLIQEAAVHVAGAGDMSPRDRNAIIGQLRNIAAQIRGFGGLVDWPTVPFVQGAPK